MAAAHGRTETLMANEGAGPVTHVVIEVHRKTTGGYQLSISALDERGLGSGYRIAGPKFCACHGSELLIRKVLDERDAAELRRYIEKVGQPESSVPRWEDSGLPGTARMVRDIGYPTIGTVPKGGW